jgi:cellulose synthase/poly-beta-1,6-N-acetylglucosamine synthase-like glycosyltransferase
MLIEWTYWLRTLSPCDILTIVAVLLLIDGPRYALFCAGMAIYDSVRDCHRWLRGRSDTDRYRHCPSVSVLIAGHNEGETIQATLASLWGSYPRLQIIVVDDGSTDNMAQAASDFSRHHAGVLVLSRLERGGKSSALNWALSYSQADIVISVDADSQLSPSALWEIVQPFADSTVGAVSATLEAWNAFTNLATWLQAYEYRQSTFLGRLMQSRMGMLDIVSGAFGAFRRSVLVEHLKGWDVGPGEDSDITLQVRKAGYKVIAAPRAICLTNVPTTWRRLFFQRLRWDRSIITLSRKHFRMAYLKSRKFRLSDLWLLIDSWFFNVIAVFAFWGWCFWLIVTFPHSETPGIVLGNTISLLYVVQLCLELLQCVALMFYSERQGRDLITCAILPFVPFYRIFLKAVRLVALTDELFLRKSYDDAFVPQKVRAATRRW